MALLFGSLSSCAWSSTESARHVPPVQHIAISLSWAHIAGLRHCSQRKARYPSHCCSCSSRRTSIICGSGMLGAAAGGELRSCSCTPDIASVLVGFSAGGLHVVLMLGPDGSLVASWDFDMV